MKKTTKFCPICEEDRQVEEICEDTDLEVRGEIFTVKAHYFRCPECGEEFETSSTSLDPLATAYMEYRRRHNMLTPNEIREFRHKYELTQKELASLLGWGAVTLSRYENGALQDKSHDTELQLARTTEGLKRLITLKGWLLGEDKRNRIVSILRNERKTKRSLVSRLEERLTRIEPGILNGYRRFDLEKFAGVVEVLCGKGGVLKTKLNKLLFYSDFLHFRIYGTSITGAQYVKMQYGPCPDNFRYLLAAMEDDLCIIQTTEMEYPGCDYTGEILSAKSEEHLGALLERELTTIETIHDLFADMGAKEISDLSHGEDGWIKTPKSRIISFAFAAKLRGISEDIVMDET